MNPDLFCEAFCQLTALHTVPIGFVFKTPFRRSDGDAISLYIRRHESDEGYRIEDDGQTVTELEMQGFDLDNETRRLAFLDLLREYDAFFDDTHFIIHSSFVDETQVPALAVRFSALLLRVQDFLLMSRERARSTFRDDLVEMVEAQFGSTCSISLNRPLQPSMKDYVIDILVRAPDGRSLAIFAGNSELRALECLLFWKEFRERKLEDVKAMLVLESAKPPQIKDRTFSRVVNSGVLLASMDGEDVAIRQKMADGLHVQ